MNGRQAARDKAMINFGLYFEHDWHGTGVISRDARRDWQRRIAAEIHSYVDTLYADAAAALGGQIRKTGAGNRFFVFNPLGWARTDVAERPYSGSTPVHVVDMTTGQEVPSQIVSVSGEQRLQILAADVPSVGYKVFEIRGGAGQVQWPHAAALTGPAVLENDAYRITFSGRGAITSWLDKRRGNRELVQASNGYYVNDLGGGTGSVQLESAGPVSVTLVATAATPLAHTTRLTVVKGSTRIALENRITQNFGTTESWRFGFNASSPDVFHEELGAVLRAKLTSQGGHYATRNARYDWLTLNHFADINASDGVGVTLSNADLYFMQLGNSTVTSLDAATPLVKVLAGGQVDGPTFGIPNQGGDSNFLQRFALQSHGAYDAAAAMRFALEHQNSFVTGAVGGGTAYPETSYSLLTISDPGTVLWTLKPADDGIAANGLVVRLWNLRNAPAAPAVQLVGGSLASAARTSHIETFEENAAVQNGALLASLGPNQLRTYALRPAAVVSTPPSTPSNLRITR
jgi:alpha-mannosidase